MCLTPAPSPAAELRPALFLRHHRVGRVEDAALQIARTDSGHGHRAGRGGMPAYHDFVANGDGARAAHRRIDSEAAVRVLCHGAHYLDVCRELALLAGGHDATQRGDLAVQTCVRQVEVGVAPAVLGQLVARFGVDDEV